MYKYLIVAVVFTLLFVGSPILVSAQQGDTFDQTPASDNSVQIGGTTDNWNDDFDWLWLLPLIAIPFILYYLFKRKDKDAGRPKSGEPHRD
jgi:hypothetical protein